MKVFNNSEHGLDNWTNNLEINFQVITALWHDCNRKQIHSRTTTA